MKEIDVKILSQSLKRVLHIVKTYAGVLLFLVFALVYGFIVLRINALSGAPVAQSDIDAQAKTSPTLRLDKHAAEQLQTLKDNSVNVQTLFTQDRTNPFQE